MKSLDLIHLQITLEYALDQDGLLIPFPGSSEQALLIIYRHAEGYLPFFNQRLPLESRSRILALDLAQAFESTQSIERLISEYLPVSYDGQFVSAMIPHQPDLEEFTLATYQNGQVVICVDDQPVCWAWSERSNAYCAEVAVKTQPEHRRKGFARMAVAAWAHRVIASGRIALYSYRVDNLPSHFLGRSLDIVWYADVIGFV